MMTCRSDETELGTKIRIAQERIESLYYASNGKCYVSFSGGKDSTVLLELIRQCVEIYTLPENGIKAVFSDTGIELDITYKFVRWCQESGWYPNIEIIHPVKSFGWVIQNEGKPLRSKIKAREIGAFHNNGEATPSQISFLVYGKSLNGKTCPNCKLADRDMHMVSPNFDIKASNKCCTYMKKTPFKKYEKENGMLGAITGIRSSEGGARAVATEARLLKGGKLCQYEMNNFIYKMPIIDWTDDDVKRFIKEYNVPLSDAYTKFGFKRTGCMGCPFAKHVDKVLEYLYFHEPNKYKASMHWLKDVYIAQNVILPFDESYEREREKIWQDLYHPMRYEMLKKYRPESRLLKQYESGKVGQNKLIL